MRTIDQVIASLPVAPCERLPAPRFSDNRSCWGPRLGLAVESMARHMTDEGWQLFQGLEAAGYNLVGSKLQTTIRNSSWLGLTHVQVALEEFRPTVVIIQDKREWTGKTAGGPARGWDERERFTNVEALRERPDVFKLTVLKDAQSDRALHIEAALEAGIHAWVCYYHPRIVAHLCPWVRPEHLVRTWHSLDASLVPEFGASERSGCLVSGALGLAYPLRTRIVQATRTGRVSGIDVLPHPGYHRRGCATPDYLRMLSRYKVAICTSSVYGYALRKIVEATACGCKVITDLPEHEVMPEIEGNLCRVRSDADPEEIAMLAALGEQTWGFGRQKEFAERAKVYYDYRAVGRRLADDIETLRRNYR